MQLSRRDFMRLAALSLGLGAVGLPMSSVEAAASPLPLLSTLDALLPLHPLLQLRALLSPREYVDVIVQKSRATDSGAAIANAAGGQLLESFPLIKAHRHPPAARNPAPARPAAGCPLRLARCARCATTPWRALTPPIC